MISDWSPDLVAALQDRQALRTVLSKVLDVWPEHDAFLHKSMVVRTDSLLDTSDRLAQIILDLCGDNITAYVNDYRALCGVIKQEEIAFVRTGQYRYSTFAETEANVYSDATFMGRYMNGLLLSHLLWVMHAASLHFFRERVPARVARGGSVLEIGPGHGLLLFLALRDLGMSSATAWDLSEVSLEQTRHALGRLDALDRANFAIQDMHQVSRDGPIFDLVILSHILEHLEAPRDALEQVRHRLSKRGLVFVNIPINAPMPDHLVLLSSPQEVQDLITSSGFNIIDIGVNTTQAVRLGTALKQKTAVTCSVIAEPM